MTRRTCDTESLIARQAAGQDLGVETVHGLVDHPRMRDANVIGPIDRLAPASARTDVVDRAG